jgi:hypothetical protein
VIKTKIVVILIVTSETDTGQTKKEMVPASADVVTTKNTVVGGTREVTVIPETDIVHPGAVIGIIIVVGMNDATTIVVTKGDVKMAKKVPLTANVGRKTEIALPEMPGVRGGTAQGILTRGDATGTRTVDERTRERSMELLCEYHWSLPSSTFAADTFIKSSISILCGSTRFCSRRRG